MARPTKEHPAFLNGQLITCLGNKRALLAPIAAAVERVKDRLGKAKLDCFDAFAGSGVVSRLLKAHSRRLVSNDLEAYAAALGRCFLANASAVELHAVVNDLNAKVDAGFTANGFIEELYAPKDEANIAAHERVFYTIDNARRLDAFRTLIRGPHETMLLGPLLSKASIHANTAGVFKGFYKNRDTGIGQFGGRGADALSRIRGTIRLEAPVLSKYDCEVIVHQRDANALASELKNLDFAYLDPPYNQHPYGSNYFMLNLLTDYRKPEAISDVSGIPKDWARSGYNVRSKALDLLRSLIATLSASHVLVSFNDEGFIPPAAMRAMLAEFGTVEVFEERYNTFRGSRNLKNRSSHVTEQLFLVERF